MDRLQNPPEPKLLTGPNSAVEKMILASVARRMMRMAGPRYGISTRKRKLNGQNRHGVA